jgi:predicted nuclease of predicted toxin-antitoxin system
MKLLIDMNLSPLWIEVLNDAGREAIHWSSIGDPSASDEEIMTWANANQHVVFTHDLDFGAILAVTKAERPSVVQIRAQDVNPHHICDLVLSALDRFQDYLEKGALVIIDEKKARVRILPMND